MTSHRGRIKLTSQIGFVLIFGTLLALFFIHTNTRAQDRILCFGGNATIPSARIMHEGDTLTYTVNLCYQPASGIDVGVTAQVEESWHTEVSLNYDPDPLVFDRDNWDIPVAISVNIASDNKQEPQSQQLHIEHLAESTDEDFNHVMFGEYVVITVLDSYTTNYLPLIYHSDPPTPTPTPSPTPTAQWRKFTNSSGDIDTVTVHNQQIFIGSRDAEDSKKGIYRSSSCEVGISFQPLLREKRVQAISFYNDRGIAAVNGDRIYYSSNRGETWQRTDSNINQFVLAASFTNGGTAYAGTDDGVYVSTDQGVTWNKVNAGNNPTLINDITYDSTSDLIWIGALGSGVWKLQPNTNNFVQKIEGLPGPTTDRYVWDTATRSNDQIFVATTNGVYTGNGEAAWAAFGLQNIQVLSLAIVGNTLYAGTLDQGLKQKSIHGGEWTSINGIPVNSTIRDLFYDNTTFCNDTATQRHGLLAATKDGLWIYR